MSHLLNHFSLQAAKWNTWVVLALIIIWAGVVACVISSILAQPFDRKQRTFWIAIVIVVPFLGVLSYLPFALKREELPHFFMRRHKKSRRTKAEDTEIEP
jgi:uncharacterized protein YacL